MRKYRLPASALLLAIFFAAFHWKTPLAHFGDDEPMNIYFNWSPSLAERALANLMFWSKAIRPMAMIYYRPLYALFGLNPVPFTYVRITLLLINTALFFFLARRISRSWWVATLAAFPIAYHGNLAILAYDGAFIYDVLCGAFFFAALLYYVARRKEAPLTPIQAVIFLALYICALDSKEMAVSLPVLALAYEILFQRKRQWWPTAAAVAITIAFIAGRVFGPGGLASSGGYHPVFTWRQFASQSILFLNTIFYTDRFTMAGVLALWAVLLYVALRRWRTPQWDARWLFLWIWIIVTPLPVAFLRDRGGGTIYIVLAGWAMLAALALRSVLRVISRERIFSRVPRPVVMTAGLLLSIVAFVHECRHSDQHTLIWELSLGEQTQRFVDQLRALHLQPAHNSRIVFLNDPFPGSYTSLFISLLVWDDRSLDINLQRVYTLPDDQVAQRDYILDYVNGAVVVRKP